ncbi:alanine:cation symporter family protein, partial [Clostridium sporogenes]
AAVGGVAGVTVKQAIRYGVARGLFSNEAGMGSTPHAHAVAKVKHPVEQGLVAIVGVFIDTFIVLTFTALVILATGVLDGKTTGIELTQNAFIQGLGSFGGYFIAIALFFFAFSTIIGWYFFGEANVKYL